MRFIGAMINALGNLLPNRSSGPDGVRLGGEVPASGTSETEAGSGTFTHALLQFLKPETPPTGDAGQRPMIPGSDLLGQPSTDSPQEGTLDVGDSVMEPGVGQREGIARASLPLGETQADGANALNLASSWGTETDPALGLQHSPGLSSSEGDPIQNGIHQIRGSRAEPGQGESATGLRGTGPGPNPARVAVPTTGPAQPGMSIPIDSSPESVASRPPDQASSLLRSDPGVETTLARGAYPAAQPNPMGTDQNLRAPGATETERNPQNGKSISGIGQTSSAENLGSTKTIPPPSGTDGISDGPMAAAGPAEPELAESFPVDRDPSLLDPDFRTRLDRVINRMEREFGHKVVMVEGYRSPERQAAIFAQGRTQPGPVATWTQDSLHSQGRAADLQVDGSWDNPKGYARLQHVAKEEGLRVLGSKDPGHVELPEGGRSARYPSAFGRPDIGARIARPASVARPASARVATAARVAQPAAVGNSRGASSSSPSSIDQSPAPSTESLAAAGTRTPSTKAVPEVSTPPLPASIAQGSSKAPPGSSSGIGLEEPLSRETRVFPGPGESGAGDTASASSAQRTPAGLESMQGGTSEVKTAPQPQAPSQPSGIDRIGPAQRVNEILNMGETWDTQALGRLHLDMDNVDGAGTRLRLAMRGSELSGTLDLSDPVLATRMRERIGELHQALSRQGLDAQGLEARALTGIEGRGTADGDLASLLKDPLAGMARILESRDASTHQRGDDPRNSRQEPHRGEERNRENLKRDQNKENRQ